MVINFGRGLASERTAVEVHVDAGGNDVCPPLIAFLYTLSLVRAFAPPSVCMATNPDLSQTGVSGRSRGEGGVARHMLVSQNRRQWADLSYSGTQFSLLSFWIWRYFVG